MNGQELKELAQPILGNYGWQTKLAELIKLNVSHINRMANNKDPIPENTENHIMLALDHLKISKSRMIDNLNEDIFKRCVVKQDEIILKNNLQMSSEERAIAYMTLYRVYLSDL